MIETQVSAKSTEPGLQGLLHFVFLFGFSYFVVNTCIHALIKQTVYIIQMYNIQYYDIHYTI